MFHNNGSFIVVLNNHQLLKKRLNFPGFVSFMVIFLAKQLTLPHWDFTERLTVTCSQHNHLHLSTVF